MKPGSKRIFHKCAKMHIVLTFRRLTNYIFIPEKLKHKYAILITPKNVQKCINYISFGEITNSSNNYAISKRRNKFIMNIEKMHIYFSNSALNFMINE